MLFCITEQIFSLVWVHPRFGGPRLAPNAPVRKRASEKDCQRSEALNRVSTVNYLQTNARILIHVCMQSYVLKINYMICTQRPRYMYSDDLLFILF